MKTYLVGTDFTPGSLKAISAARGMAERHGAQLHLLHVVEPVDEPDSDDPETETFYQELEARSREKLEQEVRSLGSIPVQYSVRVGPRHLTILGVADELDVDMIILGSRPISLENSGRFSISHKVAVTSNRPVLLVPS